MTHSQSYRHQGVNLGSYSNPTLSDSRHANINTGSPRTVQSKSTDVLWGRRETMEAHGVVAGSRS